jgi:hypothetical protein
MNKANNVNTVNKNSFLKHIENTRDCGMDALDQAVKKGMNRAKNDRLDPGKLFKLAAACVFTLAMCFTVNLRPFDSLAETYFRNWNNMMPGAAYVLDGFMDIADSFYKYLGGK